MAWNRGSEVNRVLVDPGTPMVTDGFDNFGDDDDMQRPAQQAVTLMVGGSHGYL